MFVLRVVENCRALTATGNHASWRLRGIHPKTGKMGHSSWNENSKTGTGRRGL